MRKLTKKQVILGLFIILLMLFCIIFIVFQSIRKTNLVSDDLFISNEENNFSSENIINNQTNAELSEDKTIENRNITTSNTEIAQTTTKEEKELPKQSTQPQKTTTKGTTTESKANNKEETKSPTSVSPPNTSANNDKETTSNTTVPKEENTSQDTVKRISEKQMEQEIAKYASDIKRIKPGLKYSYSKRGQVFWPYRTSEIDVAVGNVSFGTVYYYVEKFIEGNQEKFRYYIDWAGN